MRCQHLKLRHSSTTRRTAEEGSPGQGAGTGQEMCEIYICHQAQPRPASTTANISAHCVDVDTEFHLCLGVCSEARGRYTV